MLLVHSLQYLLARGVPGILNFLAIAIYTRLLDPDQYGVYTITIAAVGVVDAMLLQWLRLALLRFLPQADVREKALATILRLFLVVGVSVTALTAAAAWLVVEDQTMRWIIVLGCALFLVQGAFELTVEWERSSLSPGRYGLYAGTKSVVGVAVGTGLAIAGWGAAGLLVGMIVSMVFPLMVYRGITQWAQVLKASYDSRLAKALALYGLPLTATATLGFIVSASDRFMIAAYLNQSAAGKYAVGYDISQFTLGTLLTVVNLAAYPLVVGALERQGPAAAREMLRWILRLLLAVGLPAAVGLSLLADNISAVMVGAEFREAATSIMPWIAASALIMGLKVFYFDLAFQLSRSTVTQVWIMLAAATVNVGLNVWLIPLSGILGAAYATLAAYLLALGLSWFFGRSEFAVPAFDRGVYTVVIATVVMALGVLPFREWSGAFALIGQVVMGLGVYFGALLLLDRRFFSSSPRQTVGPE